VLVGFAPWIVFTVLCSPSTWEWATLTALLVAVILVVPDWVRYREVGLLDAVSIVFFGVLALLALVLDRDGLIWVEDRAQLLSSAALFLVSAASLAVRRPFTEYYARRSVPKEYWTSPLFRRVNVAITAVWTVVFLLNALCDLLVVAMPGTSTAFNWIVPVLLLVAAIKFTIWYPEHARQQERGGRPSPAAEAGTADSAGRADTGS
jgi:intracellular septation protein A